MTALEVGWEDLSIPLLKAQWAGTDSGILVGVSVVPHAMLHQECQHCKRHPTVTALVWLLLGVYCRSINLQC